MAHKQDTFNKIRLVLFYIFPLANKSHEKAKTNKVLVCLTIPSDISVCGTQL